MDFEDEGSDFSAMRECEMAVADGPSLARASSGAPQMYRAPEQTKEYVESNWRGETPHNRQLPMSRVPAHDFWYVATTITNHMASERKRGRERGGDRKTERERAERGKREERREKKANHY